jgi:hypothetical protein
VHRQPVRVGEPVRVLERRALGQLIQEPGLGGRIDAHPGERQVGRLVGVAAQEPERRSS